MRLHDVQYLVREGCRNTWQNRLMALASVGVLVCCLLLTGFSYLIFVNIDHLFQNAYEQNVVAVYIESDRDDLAVKAIGQKLEAMDNVASVEYLSKEEFLAQYADSLESATLESFQGDENPLPDTYIVSLVDLGLFEETLAAIDAIDGVEEASYDAKTAETLTRVRRVVLGVGGAIIVVLLVVSLFIIANTIKLTVYNRRLEIYIMKSVGATDSFVRLPFIVEGILLGLGAGILGYGLISLVYTSLVNNFQFDNPLLSLLPFSEKWLTLLLGFLLGGVLVGVCGSAISMGKYLKQEGSARI